MPLERFPRLLPDPVTAPTPAVTSPIATMPVVTPVPAPNPPVRALNPPTPSVVTPVPAPNPPVRAIPALPTPPVQRVAPGAPKIVAQEINKYVLALEPTHGGYLPKGLSSLSPLYFAPQPIGFVDPSAYGFSHEWALGFTYSRLALLYTNPAELERQVREGHQFPHPPATPKRITGPGQVGLFDYPFLIFGGGLDYLSTRTAPLQTGATITPEYRAQLLFNEELQRRLSVAPPGVYPVVNPDGRIEILEVTPGGYISTYIPPKPPTTGTFPPISIPPTNVAGQGNADRAEGIRKELITERADP